MNSILKEFENFSVEKKTLSTALGFELRSFDCQGNPSAVESVFFSTERYSNSLNIKYLI